MNCQALLNVEDLYAEDRLSAARKAELEAHLEGCPACRAKLKMPLKASLQQAVTAPTSLKDRLKKNLESMPELRETAPETAPALLSPMGEVFPVLISAVIYVGLAVLLAWFGPGVRSQSYESLPSGYGRMSP